MMNPFVKRFYTIADRFLADFFILFPQEASELGLHQYDIELGKNDISTHHEYVELLKSTLREVETLPDHHFTGDDWLDRRAFLAMLRTHLLNQETLERWKNNPQIHCDAAIQAIFGLVVRNAENVADALPALESRLQKLPRFLAEGAAVIRKPVPLWTKLAIQTCAGAGEFLGELEKSTVPLSKNPTRLKNLFKKSKRSFTDYAASISGKASGVTNGYSIGRDHFEFLIRERLGLSYSLPEIESMGHDLVESLTEERNREARKFGRGGADRILQKAAESWTPTGKTLLNEYEIVTRKIRTRFTRKNLLTFPKGETLKVLPVPTFLRHQFPTAAYLQPGPFDKVQTGIFWVNDLSLAETDPARKAAEIRQHFGVELTCAHEAYPGHHLQFVIQNKHRSKLRRLFSHAIFYEGWTLWCEKMCVEESILETPHAKLLQLNDALWRACRIVIDCGLHSGKLTYGTACRYLTEKMNFTATRARGDVNWYTSSPTVPMSYLLGRMELEKLHAKLVVENHWSVKKFNDWILSFGAVPWSWIWESQLRTKNSLCL